MFYERQSGRGGNRVIQAYWFALDPSPAQQRMLAADGSRLVVDPAEIDDDLTRDMTELLTPMCTCRFSKKAAAKRAAHLAVLVLEPLAGNDG
jgi:hypothetical protein